MSCRKEDAAVNGQKKKKTVLAAVRAAFPHTLPVMAGDLFLGIAFGLLVRTGGFPIWYPVVMSVCIYSGALEFAAIPLLTQPFDPFGAFIMGLMISARHLFYGIPMLQRYADAGKWKIPLIFTLTDESFSVLTTAEVPEGVRPTAFYAAVSLLHYAYWVTGSFLGALCGSLIRFNTEGIDFALNALFIVLFLEQIKTRAGAVSGAVGFVISAVVLAVFGSENMVLIALGALLAVLLLGKGVMPDE